MKKWGLALLLLLCIGLACAALAEGGTESVDERVGSLRQGFAEQAAEHAPQVKTLKNGVKIQRTPGTMDTDQMATTLMYGDTMGYNTIFLEADRRGCGACHDNIAELVDNMTTVAHNKMNTESLGIDMTVRQCMYCHDFSTGLYDEAMGFGSLMHTLHGSGNQAFGMLGGDCWSCHYASEDGKGMQLWDNVKHDLLRGITPIAADELQYDFTYTQDKVLTADEAFHVVWFWVQSGVDRYAYNELDLKPDPETDGVYDQWEISVTGQVSNPFTMTLSELIDTFGPTTTILKNHCGINGIGAPWIGNFEITGISVNDMLEYAGAREDATILDAQSDDYGWYASTMDGVKEGGAYLVYEIGGEPLPYSLGYPVTYMCGSGGAWMNTKNVTNLEVVVDPLPNEDYPMEQVLVQGYASESPDGLSYFKPNVGLCHFHEGQIIPADQPYTFEGYADAWNVPIDAVEFSFDRGATWVRGDTQDSVISKWVYWYFNWTPPAPGAYTVQIRSVAEDGSVTVAPVDYLVNVQ